MEIKLKKNGWHRKLQVWVLGNSTPQFMNFCPYFWLTNFCIIFTFLIPIVPLIKLVIWICRTTVMLFNLAADWFERAICNPLFESSALRMDEDTLVKSWHIHDYNTNQFRSAEEWADYEFWTDRYFGKHSSSYSFRTQNELNKKFKVWKSKTPNWEEKLAKVKEQRKKDWADQQAKQEKNRVWLAEQEVKNREKIQRAKVFKQKAFTAIVKYTKWLAIAIGLALLCWIGYWVYVLIKWSCAHFYYDRFITVMKYIGVILGSAVILTGVIFLFFKLFKSISCRCLGLCKLFDNAACRFMGKYLLIGLKWIAYGVIGVGVAIGGFFKFFWDYIMAVKKDYCPGIVWEQEHVHDPAKDANTD